MKTKLVSASLALGLIFLPTTQAQADVVSISHTFSGFAFEKTNISAAMTSEIRTWLASNTGFTSVSCFGFTGYNVFNRTKAFMMNLATTRAKNICNFVKNNYPGIRIDSIGGIPSTSRNPNSRRVTITLGKTGNSIGGGGTGDGTATGVTATCDTSVNVKMTSRLFHGDLYLNQVVISDISSNCAGKKLDFYLVDSASNQLGVSMNRPVSGTTLTIPYTAFDVTAVKTTQVSSVAISIHD
jgi:hypothetical protein